MRLWAMGFLVFGLVAAMGCGDDTRASDGSAKSGDAGATRRDARAIGSDASAGDAITADAGLQDVVSPDGSAQSGDAGDDDATVNECLPDAGPPEPICDGSDGMRLAIISSGDFMVPSDYFMYPYGSTFLFVDGKCRFYAFGGLEHAIIVTGVMSNAQSLELSSAIGYAFIGADLCRSTGGGPGSGVTEVYRPGTWAYYCECKTGAVFNQAEQWARTLSKQGKPIVDTDISAVALGPTGSPIATTLTWPLSRAMTSIPGLIGGDFGSGARFTEPAETAALRDLRAKALSSEAFIDVVDAGKLYHLYLRDDLPADVVKALDDLGVPHPSGV